MSDQPKQLIKTALITTLGLSLAYFLNKYRNNIGRCLQQIFHRKPLGHLHINLVNTEEECMQAVEMLRRYCAEYRVLGFDCEWVNSNGSRNPVALLQLASQNGYTALFRLSRLKKVPNQLKELLEDYTILKVGVGPVEDAQFLAYDYSIQVSCTSDLRFLAQALNCKPQGLSKMSYEFLGVILNKSRHVRCSNWEAPVLSDAQLDYAAKDALVAVEIFKKLASTILVESKERNKSQQKYRKAVQICVEYAGRKYKQKSSGNSQPLSKKGQNSKSCHRNYSTLQQPLYSNCYLLAPDGEVLSTCDRNKAEWYIKKSLGFVVSEEPFTVKLKFEPSSRPVGEAGQYYTQPKINQCVVCGRLDSYLRKNVIPREYRRLFPVELKEHSSHDVLLLCVKCHRKSNIKDLGMRRSLASLCGAPLESEDTSRRLIESPDLRKLKSAARALLYNAKKIPEDRKKILRDIVSEWFPDEYITKDILIQASEIVTAYPNKNFESHAEKVLEYFTKIEDGIFVLERFWREHFLDVMKPKFMPPLWSTKHNENRIEIRAGGGACRTG